MKKVEGFNYSVTRCGKVYSHWSNRFLKPSLLGRGYHSLTLHGGDGTSKGFLVHRLVALTYLSNPDNLPTVNHLDGNKLNNHVTNLEWCSYSDNNKHALETGLRTPDNYKDVELAHKVISYTCDGWRKKDICVALGITEASARHILFSDSFKFIRDEYDWDNRPNKSATISDEKVVGICEMLEQGKPYKEISDKFGVTTKKIGNIKNRVTYRLISQSFSF